MKKCLWIIFIVLLGALLIISAYEITLNIRKTESIGDILDEQAETPSEPMKKENAVYLLLIGNSYINRYNMPQAFQKLCDKAGLDVVVRTYAFDGAYLRNFRDAEHVRATLRKGRYDIVVLQEESHVVRSDTAGTAEVVKDLIREADSHTEYWLYETMSYNKKPEEQVLFTRAYEDIAKSTGAGVIPVGRDFWEFAEAHPGIRMFDDGQHPSVTGYNLIAQSLFEHLKDRLKCK